MIRRRTTAFSDYDVFQQRLELWLGKNDYVLNYDLQSSSAASLSACWRLFVPLLSLSLSLSHTHTRTHIQTHTHSHTHTLPRLFRVFEAWSVKTAKPDQRKKWKQTFREKTKIQETKKKSKLPKNYFPGKIPVRIDPVSFRTFCPYAVPISTF